LTVYFSVALIPAIVQAGPAPQTTPGDVFVTTAVPVVSETTVVTVEPAQTAILVALDWAVRMLPKTVVVTFALLAGLWPPPIVTNDGSPHGGSVVVVVVAGPALLVDATISPTTSAEERMNPLLVHIYCSPIELIEGGRRLG
jgi:hypothetical protein